MYVTLYVRRFGIAWHCILCYRIMAWCVYGQYSRQFTDWLVIAQCHICWL